MKTCPKCQQTYPDDVESCPKDGAQLSDEIRDERECPYCAEKVLRKARVCKHCGRDVEPNESVLPRQMNPVPQFGSISEPPGKMKQVTIAAVALLILTLGGGLYFSLRTTQPEANPPTPPKTSPSAAVPTGQGADTGRTDSYTPTKVQRVARWLGNQDAEIYQRCVGGGYPDLEARISSTLYDQCQQIDRWLEEAEVYHGLSPITGLAEPAKPAPNAQPTNEKEAAESALTPARTDAVSSISAKTPSVPYKEDYGPMFTLKSSSDIYSSRYESIHDVDFQNLTVRLGGDPIELRNGKYELKSEVGHTSVEFAGVHYLDSLEHGREYALVLYEEEDGGGSTNQEGIAKVLELEDNRLRDVQLLEWDLHHPATYKKLDTFNETENTLEIASSHYRPGDAHCCVSAVDIVVYRWDGERLNQASVRTELLTNDSGSLQR